MLEHIAFAILPFSDRILRVCFIAIAALIAIGLADVFFKKALYTNAPSKRARTLAEVLLNIIKVVMVAIAILAGLSVWQVNVTPLLASAGIVGLAIGFGSQVLVKDMISGVFFIFENQFNTGDTVKIDDIEGVVETIGIRTISIRDTKTGALNVIPNGSITKVANLTDRYMIINLPITVSVKNDVDKVKRILEKIADELHSYEKLKDHFYEPIEVYALEDLSGDKMTYRIAIKTHPGKQEEVARTFRYLTKKYFEKDKIVFS